MNPLARVGARVRRSARDATLARFVIDDSRVASFDRVPKTAGLVTLDVFDTALLRVVERPADVFALTAWRYALRRARTPEIAAFVEARRGAESAARAAARAGGRGEVSLAEIYATLGERYALPAADRDALQAEEEAVERQVTLANPPIRELHERLRRQGRPVAFLSDTYLSQSLVADLLHAAGYAGPLRVFTSSAYGVTKADGALFARVAASAAVALPDLVHIGDNPAADVCNARRAGARGFWYRRPARGRRSPAHSAGDPEHRLADSLFTGLAAASDRRGTAQALAHDVAGPLYLGFAQWLHAELQKSPADIVLFCARDGLIVKRVYDRLAAFYPGAPPSIYFLASRRTLVFPGFTQLAERELDFLCANQEPLPVRAFLERIGFDAGGYTEALAAAGLDADRLVGSDLERQALARFFLAIESDVLAAAAAERTLLLRYLDEIGCANWKRIAICDIGWHGSLQRGLASVLRLAGRNMEIDGYYVGLNDQMRLDPTASMHGWLWSATDGPAAMHTQCDGREVIELFFTARHPTIVGRKAAGHRTLALFDRTGELDAANRRAAGDVQKAALATIDRYIAAFGGTRPARIGRHDAYARVERLIERPLPSEVDFLGSLVHVAGFGTTRSGAALADPPPPARALRRPSEVIAAYRKAHWPSGYLTALARTWRFAAAQRLTSRIIRRLTGRLNVS